MAKPQEKIQALALRREGWPLKHIAKKLGLSSGTVHLWCQTVQLTKEQEEAIDGNAKIACRAALRRANQKARENRLQRRQEDAASAQLLLGDLSERDLLMVGVGLYWGEGDKGRDTVGVVNMDPALLRVTLAWFRMLGVCTENIVAKIQIAPGHDVQTAEAWWSQQVGIPRTQFRKTLVKVSPTSQLKTKKTVYFGSLLIAVYDTRLNAKIKAMINCLHRLGV